MIVVVGLEFEARIVRKTGVRVICSGNGSNLAESISRTIGHARALGEPCDGLISFGVAGGLAPDLTPGTCVVGSAVIHAGCQIDTDVIWAEMLHKGIPGAVHGKLAGVSAPVGHPSAKRALFRKTGALAVDMESHIVARVGAEHGIPVAAVRVITDPAVRALPQSALVAMRPNGTTDIAAMIRSVIRRPRELPALVRTALDARAARATLVRGRWLIGAGPGGSGLGAELT